MACKYIYENKEYTKEEFYKFVGDNLVEKKSVPKYNKILFPSGNTASRIEGHTTLEEFKKQKEARINKLKKQKNDIENAIKEHDLVKIVDSGRSETYGIYKLDREIKVNYGTASTKLLNKYSRNNKEELKGIIEKSKKDFADALPSIDNEITQLKQELERIEKEGFGALKPIYNFYENTVTNILKKQGFNPTLITDEYGNTWNEITLNQIDNKKILLNKGEEINVSIDSNLRSTYFPEGNVTTLTDALKKIAQSDSVYSAIAKKLLKFSENTNTTIELVPTNLFRNSEELNLNSDIGIGYYSPKEDKIYIAENALFYNGRAEGTLLHEILHGISHYSLQGTEAANDFNKLFEYAKANLEHSHALDDIDEFLVALFTKPEFIKKLQQLKPLDNIKGYKNLFEEILDYILNLIGINKEDSLYTQAFSIATNILENERMQNEISAQINFEEDTQTEEEYIDPDSFELKNLANEDDEDYFNEFDNLNFDNIIVQEQSDEANSQILNDNEGDLHSIHLNRIINIQVDKLRNLQTELQRTAKNDIETKDRLRKRILIIGTSIKNLQENLGWSTLIFTQNKMIKNGIEILDKALQSDFKYVQNIIDDSKELISLLRSVHSELQDEHKIKLSNLENNLGDLINKFKNTSTKVANDIANEAGITYQDTGIHKKDIGFFTKFFLSVAEAKNIPELQIIAKYLDYTKNKINQIVHDLKDQIFTIKQDNLDWKNKIQNYFDSNGKFITKYLPTWEQKELEELKKQDSIIRNPDSTKQQKAIAYAAMEDWYIKNSTYQLSDVMTKRYYSQLEEWESVNEDLKENNPAMYDAEKFIFEEENSPIKYIEYIQQKKINPNYYVPGVKRRIGYRNLLVLPNNSYINPAFESIKDDTMYNFIVDTLIKSQNMLPRKITFDSGNFDKFLHEFTIDLSQQDPFTIKGLLSGLKKAFTEWYTPATENTDLNFAAKDSKGNDIEFILNPNIDKFMKSNPEDIFDILTKFYEMAVTYKNNVELLPTLQMYSDKLNERSAIKINKWGKPVYSPKRDEKTGRVLKDENGKIIPNDTPDLIKSGLNNARDLVLFTIKSQIFGETKTDSGSDFVFWGDKLINYTRLLGIGLKPFSALNNYIIGTINNYAWAAKNLDFNEKERLTAMGIVSGNIFQAFNINQSLTEDAKKLTLLLAKYNVFGEQLNKFEQDTQNKLTEMMYFLMTSGEHLIHSEGFVAKMLHTKLTKIDGTEGNLWDYFNVENDSLTYNTKEYGEQNFTEITPNSLMNNWLYQFNEYRKATQGDYSNPLYINQKIWGRALMIFRRWIPQAAYQRFGEASEDGSFKGRFLSIGDISKLFQEKGDSKGMAWTKTIARMVGEATYINAAKRKLLDTNFEEEYNKLGLSTIDVQNMKVNIREMRMAAWALAIIFALGAAGGDDDDSEGLIASANLAERIFQDLTFFQNPASATSILRNPLPVITGYNKLKDLGYAGYNFLAHNSQDIYQRGFYKGYSKLGVTAIKATPGAASITSTISVLENRFNSGNSQYVGQ